MSRFIYCYAECHFAERHYAESCYAECRYAECRGARGTTQRRSIHEHSSLIVRTIIDASEK